MCCDGILKLVLKGDFKGCFSSVLRGCVKGCIVRTCHLKVTRQVSLCYGRPEGKVGGIEIGLQQGAVAV